MQRQASTVQVITQPSQRFERITQDLISCTSRDFFIVNKGAKLMGAQALNFVGVGTGPDYQCCVKGTIGDE
jgi:hypothetical protein